MKTLELNGIIIQSLDELRTHFNAPEITAVFLDGSLQEWLEHSFYEREAREVGQLEREPSSLIVYKLCRILGADYVTQGGLTPEQRTAYEKKCAVIRQYSDDAGLLARAPEVATTQA